MMKGNHNGHYDYFHTDAAVKYQARAQIEPTIKKWTKKPMPNMMLIL